MLYLLLGSDSFSKKQYIDSLLKKSGAELSHATENTTIPEALGAAGGDLFGVSKLFVFENSLNILASATDSELTEAAGSPLSLVFTVEAVDKRKKDHQKILQNPQIKQESFEVPEGKALQQWILTEAKKRHINIEPKAIDLLMSYLAGDQATNSFIPKAPVYDLWRVDRELQKLAAYVGEEIITEDTVKLLVTKNTDTEVWPIVNAIAERKHQDLFRLINAFFEMSDGNDEKAKVIQLSALLADQLRSTLLIKSALNAGMPESKIGDLTGWKSGRIFIMKKNATRFKPEQLKSFLTKLEHLDIEMKTTSTPPRVLFDMICSQL